MKLPALLLAAGLALAARAQDTVRWATNYYPVAGASLREILQSIREKRPWQDKSDHHGETNWRLAWRFSTRRSAEGCRLAALTTDTSVTLTLPRWAPPVETPPAVRAAWSNYLAALNRHEAGHAQIALGAAAELRQKAGVFGATNDCETLKQTLNQLAEETVAASRRREQDYDRQTRHGATQGAVLAAPSPGGRRNRGR